MYYCTHKNGVSLAKHLYKENRKHVVLDHVKYRKRASKIKWTYRGYHVQDNAAVAHKDVKMYCDTKQFPALPFCGSHTKPHGARGLSKYYHLRFDTKLGHVICAICHIPSACVVCISVMDTPWIYGIPLKKGTQLTCHQLYLLASSGII